VKSAATCVVVVCVRLIFYFICDGKSLQLLVYVCVHSSANILYANLLNRSVKKIILLNKIYTQRAF